MNNLMQFAMMMIQKNPQVANNPRAQEMIKVIQDGDTQRGQMIAENLCKTYGVSKEEAQNQAAKFFGLK